jgi:hypothetical protein
MRRYGAILAGILLLFCGAAHDRLSAERSAGVGQVAATYRVDLAGFNLGEFRLTATFKGSAYELKAKGRFSLLAGMLYSASGTTASAGKLTDEAPEPSSFAVDFKGGKKRERRRMSFTDGTVSQVSIIPHKKKSPRNLPVTKDQLEDVLDPLTAAFLTTRSNGRRGDLEVCRQTIPVFDGKQRFDIVLTPKRAESLEDRAPAHLSGPAAVCHVRYLPIGGYRPDHPGVKFMTQTDEIEVWLVLVPGADLYLPYRIYVPTTLGGGSVALTDIKINVDGLRRASVP